jgi:hypothetical protein
MPRHEQDVFDVTSESKCELVVGHNSIPLSSHCRVRFTQHFGTLLQPPEHHDKPPPLGHSANLELIAELP